MRSATPSYREGLNGTWPKFPDFLQIAWVALCIQCTTWQEDSDECDVQYTNQRPRKSSRHYSSQLGRPASTGTRAEAEAPALTGSALDEYATDLKKILGENVLRVIREVTGEAGPMASRFDTKTAARSR